MARAVLVDSKISSKSGSDTLSIWVGPTGVMVGFTETCRRLIVPFEQLTRPYDRFTYLKGASRASQVAGGPVTQA